MPQLQHHGTDHLELRSFDTLHIPLHGNTIGPKPRNFQDAVVDNDHISTETYIAMYHEELRQGRTRSEERLELMLEWESLKHDFNTIGRVEPEVPCLTNCYSCSFVEFVEVYACEIRMTLTCKTPESFREKYSMFSDPKSGLGLGQGVADRCKIDYKDLSRKVKEIGEVLDSTRFPCCSWRFERDLQDVLADKQQLKSQLYQLLVAEDEEEAERQRQEREAEEMYQLDMYMQRLERFIRGVAVRLHAFFSSLFIFCKFAGFSDGGEPVCTTMPWNIKPALFVLWGVCWMFYPPQGRVDLAGDQHSIVADGLLEIGQLRNSSMENDDC